MAESITRRFFNVIQLLSHSIPIIAIQVSIVESPTGRTLFFTKVLDTYEEIDDGAIIPNETHDEQFWQSKAAWTLDTAQALYQVVCNQFDNAGLNYVKNYVAITVHNNNYFWLRKRSQSKSLLGFRISNELLDEATGLLDQNNIPYVHKTKKLLITVDKSIVEKYQELFVSLAKLIKRTWQR